jgi:Domain of unknown function (DUF4402)
VKLRLIALLPLAALFGSPASGAPCLLCGDTPPVGDGPVLNGDEMPLRIEISAQLDFSRVAAGNSGGSVTIDPVSGLRRVAGDIKDLGGMALSGEAMVSGTPGRAVRVSIPAEILLDGDQGRSARVVDVTTNLGPAPRLGPDGRLRFRFGGRLAVARDDDGDYRGRIPISVEYE